MEANKNPSPCLCCTRVANPRNCENKACIPWRQWFIHRWELLRSGIREQMDNVQMEPLGVNIGGNYYPAPHQIENYLRQDPCKSCMCPVELCQTPCRIRRAWEDAKGESFL